MPMQPTSRTSITQSQKIADLDKHQAIVDVKLDNLVQSVNEIKTNHLVHINDQLTAISSNMMTQNNLITQKITDLTISDAKSEPNNHLLTKAIEFIVMAALAAGISFLVGRTQ